MSNCHTLELWEFSTEKTTLVNKVSLPKRKLAVGTRFILAPVHYSSSTYSSINSAALLCSYAYCLPRTSAVLISVGYMIVSFQPGQAMRTASRIYPKCCSFWHIVVM